MRQKEETNLVLGDFEVEVGAGELSLDDLPEPLHERAVRNVRRVGGTGTTGEQSNEFALGTDDESTRVTAFGERTGVVVVGEDHGFDGVEAADETIDTLLGFKAAKTTNGGEGGMTTFNDISHGIAIEVLVVGSLDLGGGHDLFELEEAVRGVVEFGLRIITRIHLAHERAGVDFGTWNTNS